MNPRRAPEAPYLSRRGLVGRGLARAAAPFALALLVGGCGYAFSTGARRLPPQAQRISVMPLENHTTDAEVGAWMAAALRRELDRRGALGGANAPARIEGEVLESSFGSTSVSGTYRATLRVTARLKTADAVLAERTVVRGQDWLAGIDPLESEGRRRLALRLATEAAAQELLELFEK